MSLKKYLPGAILAAFVAFAVGQLVYSTNVEAGLGGKCLAQTGCGLCCPACDHVCRLEAERVDEDIPCFEVESKVICIPRVVFPWQTGDCCLPFCKKKKDCGACDSCDGRGCSSCTNCVHNGARTRRICVLKTDKYKCPKCEYTWTAEKAPCAGSCDAGCGSKGCCDSTCDGCAVAPSDTVTWGQAPMYSEVPADGLQSVEVESGPAVMPQPAQ